MALTVGSLFSGIGGFDLGMEQAGLQPAWMCEIDKSCQGVLGRHWPGMAIYDDVTALGANGLIRPDVLVGGFPCQDLSVAGRRAGLDGKRSGLWFEFHRLIASLQPRWVIIENVPGLLSSNDGRDFAVVLRGLVECGYGVTWRVLDAQFFGVPQRRRRVFIVGSLGNGRAVQVLFERDRLPGDTPPRREAGTRVARSLANGSVSSGYRYDPNGEEYIITGGDDDDRRIRVINPGEAQRRRVYDVQGIAPRLASEEGRGHGVPTVAYAFAQNQVGDVLTGDVMHALGTNGNATVRNAPTVAFDYRAGDDSQWQTGTNGNHATGGAKMIARAGDYTGALNATRQDAVAGQFGVRRLTPVECERLQGFPDNWTAHQSDSTRYRQLGNAVAVPVAEWIGRRIMEAA